MGNEKINAQAERLEPTALMQFYTIDATVLGGGTIHLTPYVEGLMQDIWWQGVRYSAYPVEFSPLEFKGQGTLPRPSIKFANVLGTFSGLALGFNNLIGATIIRKRTFAQYLDGQPGADPTAAIPDDIFEVDRKSHEDRNWIEFELASALEVEGVMLPRRQIISSVCAWIYRSPECGFVENRAVATKDDVPFASGQLFRGAWSAAATYVWKDVVWRQITPRVKRFYFAKNVGGNLNKLPPNSVYWGEDLCSLSLNGGCALRFPKVARPFGAFPGTHKVQGAS